MCVVVFVWETLKGTFLVGPTVPAGRTSAPAASERFLVFDCRRVCNYALRPTFALCLLMTTSIHHRLHTYLLFCFLFFFSKKEKEKSLTMKLERFLLGDLDTLVDLWLHSSMVMQYAQI